MKKVRESKLSKVLVYYFSIFIISQFAFPTKSYALSSGPTQPEFNAFTPIGTSDMVDLTSGDYNYNIPIMDVGGYPINLAYNSGVTMDQEASWVGLGWNLSAGQIQRQLRGLPDDFNSKESTVKDEVNYDYIHYKNDLKQNITAGVNVGVTTPIFGIDAIKANASMNIEYNNYHGITFKPSAGISASAGIDKGVSGSVGLSFTGSASEGASVNPRIGISFTKDKEIDQHVVRTNNSVGLSLGFNTRKGIENIGMSYSVDRSKTTKVMYDILKNDKINPMKYSDKIGEFSSGSSLSFNNISFTPTSKIGYYNNNFSFNAALGAEIMGAETQMQLTGYGSYQKIADNYRDYKEPAFGYDNTHNKKNKGVLDFNRENEVSVNAKTNILHTPVFTYDTYSIQGQGISGMFRPYKSKITYLSNDRVVTSGNGLAVGIELGVANLVHTGVDVKTNPSYSYTSGWLNNNKTLEYLKDSGTGNLSYENVTYKLVNSGNVDPLESLYVDKFRKSNPLTFKIGGYKYGRTLEKEYLNEGPLHTIDRNERFKRTKVIIKVSKKEALGDPMFTPSVYGKNHHTAGMKILNEDGSVYVYGDAVYNTQKLEETYDVSRSAGNIRTGLVANGINPSAKSDQFYNSVGTPAYAHSYLLTSILSSDYEDIDNNGPSSNDLGGFTLFQYSTTNSNFYWRIPYDVKKATYNHVLNTKKINKRGNVISGTKELKYLDRIVTKTHVAFFDIDDRLDALSSKSSDSTTTAQKYLKSIRLYSLPEVTNANGQIVDPVLAGNNSIKPIKTAFFEYDYSLCPRTPNSKGEGAGKLTLKKLYFTYRNSNMGKYTPYQFDYSPINPKYDSKGFDIWGNFKYNDSLNTGEVNDVLPNATEFPYALQNSSNLLGSNNSKLWNTATDKWDGTSPTNAKELADQYATAWTLSRVILPSGGQIDIDIESDDYAYVQNKKAMQLFDVVGAGTTNVVDLNDASRFNLYDGNTHKQFLWIKLANETNNFTPSNFISKYLSENLKEYIQFKFLLNMTGNSSDYVGGYFKLGSEQQIKITPIDGKTYVAIPMEMRDREKGGAGSTNPISKTGWGFARQNLNKEVFTIGNESTSDNLKSIINELVSSFASVYELIAGVNGVLENKQCAKTFKPNKAWVRLENPDGHKLGGGLRVKSIRLSDNWKSIMNGNSGTSFDMEYGQSYDYNLENGMSSGVASYEPNGSAENALVQPFFYDSNEYNTPAENNFVEKPFGENFFPSARITYSRISVKSLDRKNSENVTIVNKHATGKVITESYTTKDFPTKVNFTPIQKETDNPSVANQALGVIQGILPYYSQKTHITATQGFSVVTNDMDGKTKSESILDQNNVLISKVEYKYNQKVVNGISLNELDSSLDVIDGKGNISKKLIGLDYDMYHDFQENYSENESIGYDGNLAVVIYGIFPAFVPIPLPKYSRFENKLNTSVTMKHVNQAGILVEKIAYDLGSTLKTKNLAWDADTAQVLLTETQNEYNDRYYSFNYPAYWYYDKMGLASENIGFEANLNKLSTTNANPNPYYGLVVNGTTIDLSNYLKIGDEVYTESSGIETTGTSKTASNINKWTNKPTNTNGTKLWVVGFSPDKKAVLLMDRNGNYVNNCGNIASNNNLKIKVVRSGNKNILGANMASITMMMYPIKTLSNGNRTLDFEALEVASSNSNTTRIINANAVRYDDFWNPQDENGFPLYPSNSPYVLQDGNVNYPYDVKVNPYVLNIKGEWRAKESYAYLTGRTATNENTKNNRTEGFYKTFNPFYKLTDNIWQINATNWTSASSITAYSPYGNELENKDALNRHSAAQFGYNNKFPMAVASNAKYSQMGFEGFEETPKNDGSQKHFGFNYITSANLSANQSHTGRKSIKVIPNQPVKLTRSKNKAYIPTQVNCPINNVLGPCYQTISQSLCTGTDYDVCRTLLFPQSIQNITVLDNPELLNSNLINVFNNTNTISVQIDGSLLSAGIFCGETLTSIDITFTDGSQRTLLVTSGCQYINGQAHASGKVEFLCINN